MADPSPCCAVDENLSTGSGQQDTDPVDPSSREADMLHHLDQERPRHRVKSLGDVNLQQNGTELSAVQPTTRQLHGSEVVWIDRCLMNAL